MLAWEGYMDMKIREWTGFILFFGALMCIFFIVYGLFDKSVPIFNAIIWIGPGLLFLIGAIYFIKPQK